MLEKKVMKIEGSTHGHRLFALAILAPLAFVLFPCCTAAQEPERLPAEAKLARIAGQCCDMFIDDLPEVLASPRFPAATRGILFDPDGSYPDGCWQGRRFERCAEWQSIKRLAC